MSRSRTGSTTGTTKTAGQRVSPRRLARWLLALIGVVNVGIGALGVFVPGLPTTIFLIIAAWCFTRSCPWLEDKLIRNRLFAPFLVYVDRTAPIPRRAKVIALTGMWLCVTVSIVSVTWRDTGPSWLPLAIVAAACIGTLAIIRWDAGVRERTGPAGAASTRRAEKGSRCPCSGSRQDRACDAEAQ